MGIRIDGNNDLIKAVDDTLTIEGISVNTSGMVTATGGIKVGTAATIHSTGQFNIGVAHTLFANGNATHSGIITATNLNLTGGSATITGATATLHLIDENDNPNYRVQNNNGTFRIYDATNDTSRLDIDSSGNISVGTAATIKATGNATFSGIVTATTYHGDGSNLSGISAGVTINNNSNGRIVTASGNANEFDAQSTLTFSNSNNDPKLTVSGSGHAQLFLTNTSGSDHTGVNFGDSDDNNAGMIQYSNNGNAMQFHTNGSEKLRITGVGGSVGINKNSPLFELVVAPTDTNESQIQILAGGNGKESNVLFGAPDDSDVGSIKYDHNGDHMKFTVGTSEIFRANSHGICLGGTGSANGLSDYEEGTYTAHFNVEGQGNMTMSGRVGLYCKVGQVVTVLGGGTVASVSGQTSGNAIQFTNLPFPVHTTSSGVGHPFPVLMKNMDSTGLGNMSGNQPYSFIGRLFTDSDAGRIEAIRADGAQDAVNASLCLASNTEVHYMFTYLTDA